MQAFNYFKKSIGLMQAALLLIAAVAIGLGLSAWEMRSALDQQRTALSQHATDLLRLSSSAAGNAAWSLDATLARELVAGITSHGGVIAAEIRADLRGEAERQLARIEKPHHSSDILVDWVAFNFFADLAFASEDLYVYQQNEQVDVGDLIIEMDPTYGAAKYVAMAESILTVSLLQAFLIGIVLLLLAQWLVTTPLRRAAAKISRIHPEALDDTELSIEVPDLHKSDELGLLLNHTNDLVERLVESQKELRLLATRDSLTGLPNRTLIKESLTNMLANAQRSQHQVAIIFVDLDRFKTVNDSLGHNVGDQLLIRVAATLLAQIREQDSIGRLGGDEFLIVMPVSSVNDVVVVVRRIIDSLATPFEIDEIDLRTGASLGIAIYPYDGDNADVLMRRADLAMYKAKADSASQWQLFSEDMGQALDAGVLFETALAGAVLRNEMQLFMQPIFNAADLSLVGCEALLRWQYKGEWMMPEKFVGVAESSGLIREIGDWVIAEACRILKRWDDKRLLISVNVSARQLADESFVERVIQNVNRAGIKPSLISFEITETTLMQNLEQSQERLGLLRSAGFKISIDDFGTGYSSLAYLTRLPIDELKIDRSFVSGTQRSSIVLSTIIAMARALEMKVVAEGVETETQRDELVQSGCDLLQGFLLGKPMPLPDFEKKYCIGGSHDSKKRPNHLRRVR